MRILVGAARRPRPLVSLSEPLSPMRFPQQAEQPSMSGIYFLLYVTDYQLAPEVER
jgi:hypothetical protein